MTEPDADLPLSGDAAQHVARLDDDPRDPAARAALQALFEAGARAPGLLQALARAHSVHQDWAAAWPVVEAIAVGAPAGETRMWALRRLAQTCRLAGELDRAFEALCDAVQASPPDEDTLAFGLELAHETGRFGELARAVDETVPPTAAPDLYRQLAAALDDGPDAARLHLRLADALDAADPAAALGHRLRALAAGPERVVAHRLRKTVGEALLARDEAEAALEHLEEAWADDDTDLEVAAALAEAYTRLERWEALVDVLQREAERVADPEQRRALWLRIATIHEETLHDAAAAMTAYAEVLEIDSADPTALDALAAHYRAQARWPELAELLGERAAQLEGAPRRGVLAALGRLYADELDDPGGAVEAWEAVRAEAPDDAEALAALDALYARLEHWRDLAEVLARRLAAAEGEARAALRDRLVTLHAEHPDAGAMPLALLRAVEKAYAQAGRWADLVGVLQREARQSEGAERAHLYARMGALWETKLDEPRLAAEAYWQALEDDALVPEAVVRVRHALGALYQGPLADPYRALEALRPLVDAPQVDAGTLALLATLQGEVGDGAAHRATLEAVWAHPDSTLEARRDAATALGDAAREADNLEGAARRYGDALDLDADHLPALEGLVALAAARDDRAAEVAALTEMGSRLEGAARARVLLRLGDLHAEAGDAAAAERCHERALEADPDNLEAARAVAPRWIEAGRWTEVARLLALLVEDDELDVDERHTWRFAAARCAEALGDDEAAIEHYRAAADLDGQHAPTWRRLATLNEKAGHPDAAFDALQMVYVLEREQRSPAESYAVLLRMGRLKAQAGAPREALDVFHAACDLDPQRVEAREAIVELLEAQSAWPAAADALRALLDVAEAPEARRAINLRLARLYEEQLDDRRMAIEALEYALVEAPDDRTVLDHLLVLNQEAGDAYAAVDLMKRLAELEPTPRGRAQRWLAIGELLQTELDDAAQAINAFEHALTADPTWFEAFRLLERALLAADDHRRLDGLYRRMLAQAAQGGLDDRVVVALATNLGEINRLELNDPQAALDAWTVVLQRRPDDVEARRVVAELYEATDQLERAVQQHQHLLDINPADIAAMQHLRRLYLELGRFDAAWCLCQALAWLDVANPEERAFFDQYRRAGLQAPRTPLARPDWDALKHPDGSPLLDLMFHKIYPYALPALEVGRRDLGLRRRKHLLDPQEETVFNRVLDLVAGATGLGRLEVYRDPGDRPGLRTVPLNPPALLVGPDLLSGRPLLEIAFWVARQLYLTGRQHVLAAIDDDVESRVARLVAVTDTVTRLVQPDAPVDADPDLLKALKRQRVAIADVDDLRQLIARLRQDPSRHLDLARWLEALDHSANRVGLVFCGDLAMALRCARDAGGFSSARPERRQAQLMRFAVSEPYFQLRQRLGSSIG